MMDIETKRECIADIRTALDEIERILNYRESIGNLEDVGGMAQVEIDIQYADIIDALKRFSGLAWYE